MTIIATISWILAKFFDHIDGFYEALHEIYAGNVCFVTPPNTEYGEVPIPPDYYIPRFAKPEKYYPLFADAIGFWMPFIRDFQRIGREVRQTARSRIYPRSYGLSSVRLVEIRRVGVERCDGTERITGNFRESWNVPPSEESHSRKFSFTN